MRHYFHRREPENTENVEIQEQWQITYWTQKLNVTQERLRQAIVNVGSNKAEVHRWLKTHPAMRKALNAPQCVYQHGAIISCEKRAPGRPKKQR
ncbi:DUF3606 domain-containing protein [Erwinia sp. 9145]|nr:DUF3606 domain-containing protein [Erwinia sp. 9145]